MAYFNLLTKICRLSVFKLDIMGTCKYCGKSAGLFSSKHTECDNLHQQGIVDLRACLKKYFSGQIDISSVRSTMMNVRRVNFIDKHDAIVVSGDAIHAYLQALPIPATSSQLAVVTDYLTGVKLTHADLDSTGCFVPLIRQQQYSVISNLRNGILPATSANTPILLAKGEAILWTYDTVTMYQEKLEKHYEGDRSSWSFRVMKGVHYHTGETKLKPIEQRYMNNEGVGTLYITNKHIIFQGTNAAQKIPYAKLIGITPYSDGIEVHREGSNVKRLTFQGFDSWFVMNVLQVINS